MTHIRQQIRSAIKTVLNAVPAFTGRVFTTRVVPVKQENLPAILVYAMEEQSGLDGSAHALQRALTVQVEAVFAGVDTLDDDADAFAVDIEKALAADRKLGGLCYDIILTATRLGVDIVGEKKNGSCVLTYAVTYRTSRANPEQTNP